MVTNTPLSAPPDPSPSRVSLHGLDAVNFFLAALLAGFGPYVAAYLATQQWTQENIGFVLTAAGLTGLLSQVPAGEILDLVRSKRALLALGAVLAALSAVIIGFRSGFIAVFLGLVLEGSTGGLLGPAIAAISLGLVGHPALAERLGRNQRFSSAGALIAAGGMGIIGSFLSYQALFLIAAGLVIPLLAALLHIRPGDIHFSRSCGAPHASAAEAPLRGPRRSLWTNSPLLIFGGCLFLFQLANASVLPLAGEALAHGEPSRSAIHLAGLIIVPQVIVVLLAPWVGRQAQGWGRRPLLLIGFAALPIRAVLFASFTSPLLLAGVQLLDGISATMFGVLTALVVADLTTGTGRFNLAQGIVGTASGVGASLSTALSGVLVGRFGSAAGLLGIAAIALLASVIFGLFMPETRALAQVPPSASMRSSERHV